MECEVDRALRSQCGFFLLVLGGLRFHGGYVLMTNKMNHELLIPLLYSAGSYAMEAAFSIVCQAENRAKDGAAAASIGGSLVLMILVLCRAWAVDQGVGMNKSIIGRLTNAARGATNNSLAMSNQMEEESAA